MLILHVAVCGRLAAGVHPPNNDLLVGACGGVCTSRFVIINISGGGSMFPYMYVRLLIDPYICARLLIAGWLLRAWVCLG